jgi:hypothetical protein
MTAIPPTPPDPTVPYTRPAAISRNWKVFWITTALSLACLTVAAGAAFGLFVIAAMSRMHF